jgi:hypothetical protein
VDHSHKKGATMRIDINVNVRISPSDDVPAWAIAILDGIAELAQRMGQVEEDILMTDRTVDELLADIADEKTQIGGLSVLTAGIKKKLDDALAGVALPAGVQAKINAAFDAIEANKVDIVTAITANTDAAPPAANPAATA